MFSGANLGSIESILGIGKGSRPCEYDISYKVLKLILEEEFGYSRSTESIFGNSNIAKKLDEFRGLSCVLQADGIGSKDIYEFVSVKRYNNLLPMELTIYSYKVSERKRFIIADTFRLSEVQEESLCRKYNAVISYLNESGCEAEEAYWHMDKLICH